MVEEERPGADKGKLVVVGNWQQQLQSDQEAAPLDRDLVAMLLVEDSASIELGRGLEVGDHVPRGQLGGGVEESAERDVLPVRKVLRVTDAHSRVQRLRDQTVSAVAAPPAGATGSRPGFLDTGSP